jgi:virulence factor Mce-like protein
MRGRRPPSVASNPVFVGAVTVLVVVAAVLLAYQANQGLPFVPTFELKVDTPDAARLVVGNEVREGGFRVGQVTKIEPVGHDPARPGPRGAQLTLKLDTSAVPIPDDTTIRIRPRSALGLKYVDLLRGKSGTALQEGEVIATSGNAVGPELDDFFSIFDEPTRANVDRNLDYFGTAMAGRGAALNRTLGAAPELLGDLPPVMRTLADPDNRLVRLLDETGDVTRVLAPQSRTLARGFTGMADTFEALSRDPQALRDTIARSPGTLEVGIAALPDTRPLLARLAEISDEVRGTAREVRTSVPAINRALAAGTPVLRRLPAFTSDFEGSLRALRDLARSPTTDITIGGLTDTMRTLNPTLQWAGPHQTVCNYFNYWWTFLADHISDEDATGTVQRVQVKMAPIEQEHSMASFGAQEPANGGDIDPVQHALFGDAAAAHDQGPGAAVDANGNADCESGQRGYPERLATGFPAKYKIVVDSRTPGLQGPTYTGRPRVPAGQSFSSEPTGIAPSVLP